MAGLNKLTTTRVRNAKPGAKLSDGGGLLFARTSGGGKWVFRYQIAGRRRDMGLGSFPAMSLAEARRERDRWAAVLRSGGDPIRERDRMRAEEAAASSGSSAPTFEEMAHVAFDAIRETLRGDGQRGRWFSPLRLHLIPKIGHIPVSSLTQRDVHDALKPIWRRKHATAVKAIQRTRIVLRHARLSGYDVDPFVTEAAKHMLGFVDHQPEPIAATP